MSNLRTKLTDIKPLWEPAGSGAEAQYSRDQFTDLFAEDAHVFVPGTWFLSGHHRSRPVILKMFEAVHRVWPVRATFHGNNYWVGEDTICIEWSSTNGTWNEHSCRNSGMTIWRFRDDKIIDWQEITDSEYFDEVHAGWREHLGVELGSNLARYSASGPPWYPNPANNEWPIETCVTDGRNSIPPHMRDDVEASIQWWNAPREQGDELFADDVHLFFQGRSWPLGGHHHGRQGLAQVLEGFRRIWPTPSAIVKTNFWANDDRVLIQWFTRNTTWKGQLCRNSGWTVWKFHDRKVVDWRTYTDTSFYAEVHAGWREAFGEAFGSQLPNWPEPTGSRYPRPEEHE